MESKNISHPSKIWIFIGIFIHVALLILLHILKNIPDDLGLGVFVFSFIIGIALLIFSISFIVYWITIIVYLINKNGTIILKCFKTKECLKNGRFILTILWVGIGILIILNARYNFSLISQARPDWYRTNLINLFTSNLMTFLIYLIISLIVFVSDFIPDKIRFKISKFLTLKRTLILLIVVFLIVTPLIIWYGVPNKPIMATVNNIFENEAPDSCILDSQCVFVIEDCLDECVQAERGSIPFYAINKYSEEYVPDFDCVARKQIIECSNKAFRTECQKFRCEVIKE